MKKIITLFFLGLAFALTTSFAVESKAEKHTIQQALKHPIAGTAVMLTLDIEVNSEFSHTISWTVDFGGQPPFSLTIPYFYGKKYNKNNNQSYLAVDYVRYFQDSPDIPTSGSVTINPWAQNPTARAITYGIAASVNNAIPWQPAWPEVTWGGSTTISRRN